MKNVLEKFKISLPAEQQTEKFLSTIRELILVLFAVVLGLGFEKIQDGESISDLIQLILVYGAIILSWWGYNFGTIAGRHEDNKLLFTIDILLILTYWFMIIHTFDHFYISQAFIVMFLFYFFWELIRFSESKPKKLERVQSQDAMKVIVFHILFFVIVFGIQLLLLEFRIGFEHKWTFSMIHILLVCSFRLFIAEAYRNAVTKTELIVNRVCGTDEDLILKAKEASKLARVQLSNYRVGACVASNGNTYSGCNIEFNNYSNTLHAEEVALAKMVSDGRLSVSTIAVYTETEHLNFPCGMCLQSLFELGGKELRVIACNDKSHEVRLLSELMPFGFNL